MAVVDTYPATVGQLSVWRDVEKMAPERRWEANVPYGWSVPPGHSADEVWAALGELAMRHESLRTTYLVDDAGKLRQRIAADTVGDAMATVRRGTADVSEEDTLSDTAMRDYIDMTAEMPWRVWLLLDGDVPARLVLIVSHAAADGFASVLMERDFQAILAGEPLEPVRNPREMALAQQEGDGARALKAAERHWRRTMESAPRTPVSFLPTERVGATLHTGIPMPMAHEGAAKLDISVASLLQAAYYRGLRTVLGNPKVLMFPLSNNRFDPDVAQMVTSLVQWVPMLLEFDAAEPFEEIAKKVHWKQFSALKHGFCDPDVIMSIRGEFEALDPPVDQGFYLNPIIAPPGFPSSDTLTPSHIEWYEPARTTGPGVYVIVRGLTSIDVLVRANRPGFGKEAVATCLDSIQDALLTVVGMA